jgi:polysaccharide export outer membrane protein
MNRTLLIGFAILLTVTTVAAQGDSERAGASTSSEVRFELPSGELPDVAIEPEPRRVVIELPRGAGLPMDFEADSGGLILDSHVEPMGEGRIRVELTLAAGYLGRVAIESGVLVLTFESRLARSDSNAKVENEYLLGPRDKIAITVHNQPDLGTVLTISRDGTITLPMLGEIRAAGLSPAALANQLEEILGRSYLVDPQVDVGVEQFNSQWVMITGEVVLPGRIILRGGTRLKEVLSDAGGFRETSGQRITISRPVADEADDFETIVIERREFEAGLKNPVLEHGDIVDVPRAAYCYIHGEVRSPGRIPIERETTLLKAITLVGGLNEWADRKNVRILSGDDPGAEEVVVNLKKIQAGKAPDPVLKGGEVVVIKRRFF